MIHQVFPNYVYFPALISLAFGNAAVLYMNLVACRETRNAMLLLACSDCSVVLGADEHRG